VNDEALGFDQFAASVIHEGRFPRRRNLFDFFPFRLGAAAIAG
jgi:hypothetical protein